MKEQRLQKRIDCEELCQLHQSDSKQLAVVKNLSLNGALIYFDGQQPTVNVGGTIRLNLLETLFFEFDCEVVRVDTPNIAVKFIGLC